ncbi:MAG: hypothetical protein CM1200mP14_00980 [Gammaproteobacteria bacterium]|nr:MAG: hypothetical protein CM1200mP14_00980 [Gammaproteobacteria bacterium]
MPMRTWDGAVPEGGEWTDPWNPQGLAWFSTTMNLQDDTDRRAALRHRGLERHGRAQAGIFEVQLRRKPGDTGSEIVSPPRPSPSCGLSTFFQLGGAYPNSPWGPCTHEADVMDADWYVRAWGAYEDVVGISAA